MVSCVQPVQPGLFCCYAAQLACFALCALSMRAQRCTNLCNCSVTRCAANNRAMMALVFWCGADLVHAYNDASRVGRGAHPQLS
jgi:hypothetical protein